MCAEENGRYTSRHASRYSTCHHLTFRIVVGSEDKGYQDRSYPPRPRRWPGSSRQRSNWIRGLRKTAWFAYRALTPRFGYGSAGAKRRQHHRLEPPIGPVPLLPKIAHALALIAQSFSGSIRRQTPGEAVSMVRELSDSIDRKIGQAREHRAEVVSSRIQRFERRPIDSNRPGWSWPLDFSHGVGLFSFARRT